MKVFFIVIVVLVLLFFIVKKIGSIEYTIKTKLSSYHRVKKFAPDLTKKELYFLILGCDHIISKNPEKREELSNEKSYRSILYLILLERYIPSRVQLGSKEYFEYCDEIKRYVDEAIPEDY